MAEQAPAALDLLRQLPARHDVDLLAGTMPWETGAGFTNRAWLLLPDGRAVGQDKLSLTPGEQDPESWNLVPGDALRIVERSEEHTSELQSLMRISYAVFCLQKKTHM